MNIKDPRPLLLAPGSTVDSTVWNPLPGYGTPGEGAARDRHPSSPEPTEMNGCESTRTPPPHTRLYRFWTPLPGYGTPVMCEGAARDRLPSSP
ncbi:hypothetical protein BKA57DRAFT_508425 [Linnemannia elongata]|nr:hypothetical protein BKA57DRAFT_508425 [Linnemannia elongata]